jgi:hypothetical protein
MNLPTLLGYDIQRRATVKPNAVSLKPPISRKLGYDTIMEISLTWRVKIKRLEVISVD